MFTADCEVVSHEKTTKQNKKRHNKNGGACKKIVEPKYAYKKPPLTDIRVDIYYLISVYVCFGARTCMWARSVHTQVGLIIGLKGSFEFEPKLVSLSRIEPKMEKVSRM